MRLKYKHIAGVLLSKIRSSWHNAIPDISSLWKEGDVDMWSFLFKKGFHQAEDSNNTFFALAEAIKDGNTNLVSFLLKKGANPFFEIDEYYIEKRTSTRKRAQMTPGMFAVSFGQNMVKLLIGKNKKILNYESTEGETMFSWAVRNNNLEFAKYLISAGANVKQDHGGIDGNYPIHNAVNYRNYEMIELLLKNKVDINVTNERGESVLHIAFDCAGSIDERFKMIKYLCTLGVNPNLKANYSRGPYTPFDTAMDYKRCVRGEINKQEYQEIANFLKNYETEYNNKK